MCRDTLGFARKLTAYGIPLTHSEHPLQVQQLALPLVSDESTHVMSVLRHTRRDMN